jgi:hypothetical protein
MRKTNLKRLPLLSFLLLIIIMITASGCGNSISAKAGNYSVFKFSDDDIRFKLKGTLIHEHPLFIFEYPSSFTKINDEEDALLNMRVTLVSFEHQARGVVDSLPKTNLSVSVHEPGLWNDTDAVTTVNNIILYHNMDQDFKIIERTSAQIADINGDLLSYSYRQPEEERFGSSPIPAYNGVVKFYCFDYQGFIWRVCLNCLEKETSETEVYFQHILDTLQILD